MTPTEVLPLYLIDISCVERLNVSGKGGKESTIIDLLPTASRNTKPLFDLEIKNGIKPIRIEIKKQKNLQWFDIRKYHNLSQEDREIVLLFINHGKHGIDLIAAIQLGSFLDFVLSKADLKEFGWSAECIKKAHALTRPDQYPKLQFKAGLRVRDLINEHRELFQVIYESQ